MSLTRIRFVCFDGRVESDVCDHDRPEIWTHFRPNEAGQRVFRFAGFAESPDEDDDTAVFVQTGLDRWFIVRRS